MLHIPTSVSARVLPLLGHHGRQFGRGCRPVIDGCVNHLPASHSYLIGGTLRHHIHTSRSLRPLEDRHQEYTSAFCQLLGMPIENIGKILKSP